MGRVIGIGPDGRPRALTRQDHWREVIDIIRAAGGLDQLYITPPLRNHEHAQQVSRDIYRSARYYCSCGDPGCSRKHKNTGGGCPDGGQRISARPEVVKISGPEGKHAYAVQFRLHDKMESWRSLIAKYGEDRSKWPYDPWAKRLRRSANAPM